MYFKHTSMTNNFVSFEAQFMKKFSDAEAELKKDVVYEKACGL